MVDTRSIDLLDIGVMETGDFRGLAHICNKGDVESWRALMDFQNWPPKGRPVDSGKEPELIEEVVSTGYGTEFTPERLYVRLDGSVYYKPLTDKPHIVLFFDDTNILRCALPAGHSIVVNVGILHCLPFEEGADECKVRMYRRHTNGLDFVEPSFGIIRNPFEIMTIQGFATLFPDEFKAVSYPLQQSNTNRKYEEIKEKVDEATFKNDKGKIVPYFKAENWPRSNFPSTVRGMRQEFTMEWIDCGDTMEIEFVGLSGTLAGGKGRPGVVYNKQNKTISVNLLLRRVDGTFSIECEEGQQLCMIVSPPGIRGDPIEEGISVVNFNRGVRLPSCYWHSVPFPPPTISKIHLSEVVAETNSGQTINVQEELGRPLVIQL